MSGVYADTSSGRKVGPEFGAHTNNAPFAMRVYNGLQVPKKDRQAPTSDYDLYPRQFRRYVNVSVTDVQINNGLRWRVGAGLRIGYAGTGFLYGVVPQIPGQTRDNAAGYHKRGPSPYNMADVFNAGPGSQPAHPGGPGKIAAVQFYNPMTG